MDYLFGLFGLSVKGDHATEDSLLTFRRLELHPYLEGDSWHLELEASWRTTDYDRIQFTNVPIQRPTGTLFVSGFAELSQADTGLGATLDLSGEVWHGYASYCRYTYGDFHGATDVTLIKDASGRISQAIFNALAQRLEARLTRQAGSHLARRAGILDESATLGVDARLGRWKLGLEFGLDTDHITSDQNKTATGLLAWDATRHCTLELRPGATQTPQFGTISFVGLTVVLRTIPRVF